MKFLFGSSDNNILGLCRGGRRGGRFGRKRGSDSPGGRWNKSQKVEA